MNKYKGIVLKQFIQKMVSEVFPEVSCESGGKDCTCPGHKRIPGKKGRPVSNNFAHFANSYHRMLPSVFLEKISHDVNLIRATMDALCEARRELTPEEQDYINNSRDAQVMGMLNDEPVQLDYHTRHLVQREEGENLGMACLRRFRRIVDFSQEEANYLKVPLYIYLEKYCVERNLRDEKTALNTGAPVSAVGLMSRNVAAFVVTDCPKEYKGSIALVHVCEPEIKVRTKNTEEEILNILEEVGV